MRRWPRRFAATVWEDPTRQIQVLGSGAAFMVAYWLLRFETPADTRTSGAIFYFVSEHAFAAVLILSGLVQLLAVAGPSWQARAGAAIIKLTVWVYATACFWLTNANALASALLPVFAVAEFWIAYRALHDKEVNGTDRRNDGLCGALRE